MRFLCEACERLAPPAAFRVDGGLLVVRCSRCEVESRWSPPADPLLVTAPVIALSGSDALPEPIQNEPTRPIAIPASLLEALEAKAAREQETVPSNVVVLRRAEARAPGEAGDPFTPPPGFCPKCIGVRKADAAMCPHCGLDFSHEHSGEFHPSPEVASTWLGVVEQWEHKGAHDKVLALASEKGELAALGRLYRIQLARSPRDAMAKRGREEVLRLAAAGSLLLPTPVPDKRARMRTAGLAFLFLLVMMAVVFIITQSRRLLAGGP